MTETRLLPSFRRLVLAAFVITTGFVVAPGRGDAQATESIPAGPTVAASEGDRLVLAAPMLRARRSIRAGATLFAVGGAGMLASGLVLARLDERSCATDEPFCDQGWTKGMGALSGMIVGSAFVATGLVTMSFGLARRNRLLRVSDVALGVAPDRLQLSLHF